MKTMISRRSFSVRCRHRIRICCPDCLRRLFQQHCIFHRIPPLLPPPSEAASGESVELIVLLPPP